MSTNGGFLEPTCWAELRSRPRQSSVVWTKKEMAGLKQMQGDDGLAVEWMN